MDEKEAEARPVMGTIFLVRIIRVLEEKAMLVETFCIVNFYANI